MAEHPRNPDTPMTQDNESWLQPIKRELDASARDLDAATLSRLNRTRQQALAAVGDRRTQIWPWLALATAASIALVMLLLPLSGPDMLPESTPVLASTVEDFELLTEDDAFALYSDLDFYAWLESQDVDG